MKKEEKPIGIVTGQIARCRCGHEWLPRGEERPRVCPKCKSANWDQQKKWVRKKQ
jgi:predicted Zn-ribbon and HTH transcriptional regulator